MTFSRKQATIDALAIKLRRAKFMASHPVDNSGTVNDYSIRYPSDVRNAEKGNFTELIKRVTEETLRKQDQAIFRRKKTIGQN